MFERLDDAIACGSGCKEAAIEQHQVGPDHRSSVNTRNQGGKIRMCCGGAQRFRRSSEKSRQVARDRGVALVRQPELTQSGAAVPRRRPVGRRRDRQKLVERPVDVATGQVGRGRRADDGAPRTKHRNGNLLGRRVAEHPLFGGAAQAAQDRPLSNGQAQIRMRFDHSPLDDRRKRQIDIVAAEQQMIADRDALERRRSGLGPHANQAEIGGAAADVAHQRHALAVGRKRLERPRAGSGSGCPRIKGGDRFFDQREVLELRLARGFDRQLARLFVERGGNGQDNALALESPLRLVTGQRRIPRIAQVRQVVRRGVERGNVRP